MIDCDTTPIEYLCVRVPTLPALHQFCILSKEFSKSVFVLVCVCVCVSVYICMNTVFPACVFHCKYYAHVFLYNAFIFEYAWASVGMQSAWACTHLFE